MPAVVFLLEGIDDLYSDDFFCSAEDAVHLADPYHGLFGLQTFCDAFLLCFWLILFYGYPPDGKLFLRAGTFRCAAGQRFGICPHSVLYVTAQRVLSQLTGISAVLHFRHPQARMAGAIGQSVFSV